MGHFFLPFSVYLLLADIQQTREDFVYNIMKNSNTPCKIIARSFCIRVEVTRLKFHAVGVK